MSGLGYQPKSELGRSPASFAADRRAGFTLRNRPDVEERWRQGWASSGHCG